MSAARLKLIEAEASVKASEVLHDCGLAPEEHVKDAYSEKLGALIRKLEAAIFLGLKLKESQDSENKLYALEHKLKGLLK